MSNPQPSFSFFFFLFSFLVAVAVFQTTTATDHIVGAHLGWNPNVSYTDWINNQTFYVGDLISFRYQKYMYNVFEVNKTGYDNCTTYGAVGNWTKGKDFIPLDEAKRYYFICNGFCQSGMKISVLVHPLPLNASSSSSSSSSSGNNATQNSASVIASSATGKYLNDGFGGVAAASVLALVAPLVVRLVALA